MSKRISYSALAAYEQCPLKFKFEYIDNLRDIYHQRRAYLSFGESIHIALRKFFEIREVKERTLDKLRSVLLNNWVHNGYATPEEENEYKQQALSVVEQFYTHSDINAQPLYLEEFFQIPVGNFFLTCKIDRIDELTDDNVEVIDYKTGKFLPGLEGSDSELSRIQQLRIYAFCIWERLRLFPQKLSVYYLQHNKKISTNCTQKQIKETKKYIVKLYKRISKDNKFLPKKGAFCKSCDYSVICPVMGLGIKPAEREKLKEDYKLTIKSLESIRNDLYTLNRSSVYISGILDTDTLIKKSLDMVMRLADVDKGVFIGVDEQNLLNVLHSVGITTTYKHPPLGPDGLMALLKTNEEGLPEAQFVNDLDIKKDYRALILDDSDTKTLMLLPLLAKRQFLGLIVLGNHRDGSPFDNYDVSLLQNFAVQIAISLHNAKLYELAITDGLTKLYIRRHFLRKLNYEIERSKKFKTDLNLMMIDIDHFKKINDEHGHPAGDSILCLLADLLKSEIDSGSTIARYGGEEFIIILPQISLNDAKEVAERLRSAVENYKFAVKDTFMPLTVSIGVAGQNYEFCSEEKFIEQADTALYKSKQLGRNRVTVYSKRQ